MEKITAASRIPVLAATLLLAVFTEAARAQGEAEVTSESRAALTLTPYKHGEAWPLRSFEGADVLEPFLPLAALDRGDVGRIAVDSALPYALLASAFAFEHTDERTIGEIQRWRFLGVDDASDNYVTLYALLGIAAASAFLPSPDDRDGYSLALRADRLTVFALGEGISTLETELLKPVFRRRRPNGNGFASRPSGHATTAFASAAFLSDIVRETFRPQDEKNVALRLLGELACAVPYTGAFYIALERVHGNKHFLTDTLLGGAIGAFTMHAFYAWSFTRHELDRAWFDRVSFGYNHERRALEFAFLKTF